MPATGVYIRLVILLIQQFFGPPLVRSRVRASAPAGPFKLLVDYVVGGGGGSW